jgi:cytochrome c oxidase subunit 2
MTEEGFETRRERRLREREVARSTQRTTRHHEQRSKQLRALLFSGIVFAVLGIGGILAFGDFFDRPSAGTTAGTIDVQSSMAGFTPSDIRVKAGETVTFNWWTDDAAVHLAGGVHTMISPDLGLREELAAESNRKVTWAVPNKPGTYDVWCDSCCGGEDSPTMHGKIVVEPAAASVERLAA